MSLQFRISPALKERVLQLGSEYRCGGVEVGVGRRWNGRWSGVGECRGGVGGGVGQVRDSHVCIWEGEGEGKGEGGG
jgi:hypothetical protein